MLQHNISILDKQQEGEKLRGMINDEEKKLQDAKKAFEEDTQRFNTFLFEAKQVGDKLDGLVVHQEPLHQLGNVRRRVLVAEQQPNELAHCRLGLAILHGRQRDQPP